MSTYGRFNNPVEAVLTGVKEFISRKTNIRPLNEHDRLDGKVCVVTGANSGVGFAIALELARRGADLIMACRSGIPDAGEQVKALSGSDRVRMMKVDLSDLDSINQFCEKLQTEAGQIDVIICNAGVAPARSRRTPQGLDEMYMVNYEAKFILLNTLLRSGVIPNDVFGGNGRAAGEERPRILFTSSDSHRNASTIDFDALGVYRDLGVTGAMNNYSYYKLVLNTFATELSRRLNPGETTDVSVHAICPGPVNTNIIRNAPFLLRGLLRFIFWVGFQSPEKAAPPLVYMACAREEEGLTNQYLHMMARKRMDEKCYDPEAGKLLWERSEAVWQGMR